jgi:hypothetical protein
VFSDGAGFRFLGGVKDDDFGTVGSNGPLEQECRDEAQQQCEVGQRTVESPPWLKPR